MKALASFALVRADVSTALVVTLVLAAGTASAGAGVEKRKPAVSVTSEAPVIVTGRGFAARERIVLRVSFGGHLLTRRLRATRRGTFRAAFADTDASCYPFTVVATGSAGSRATRTRRFTIPPPCGIAPQP